MMKIFLKIDKLAAWVLFFCMIVYGISGYAMTKGIFSPALANQLHLHLLGPIALLAFVFHTAFAIHLAFRRWKIWNKFTLVLLILFYLGLAGYLVYLDSFYKPVYKKPITSQSNNQPAIVQKVSKEDGEQGSVAIKVIPPTTTDSNSSVPSVSTPSTPVPTPISNPTPQEKTFTLNELAQYNGQNGQLGYVAVDGVVYDMSSVFRGGYHQGYQAGADLSDVFHSQHDQSYLNGYPVVGKLK